MASLVETVFDKVQSELLAFGRARSVDFRPWLDTNRPRLLAMTRLIDAVAQPEKEPAQVLAEIERLVTARLPREGAWFERHKKLLGFMTRRTVLGLQSQVIEQPAAPNIDTSVPPDLRTPTERTAANIRAIQLLARGTAILPEERELLRQYSGWGGLSIKGLTGKIPAAWIPEQRGQIHEYYTPTAVARAVAETLQPRIAELAKPDGSIVALEPSAGIGRFIEALSGPNFAKLHWHAAEYSRISGQLLAALRPDVDVYIGPLERWLQDHTELQGEIDLVVSNPPYGERGAALYKDPDKFYQEPRAYAYQLRRTLDWLRPGGIGVYLVPAGFMTGLSAAFIELRRKVLRRHHLMAAFRLPSETEDGKSLFPGALLVIDVLYFRARGGELADVIEEDKYILEGRYFKEHPAHILGTEAGREEDEDDHTSKPRWGYQVRGNFERIPAFEERPLCRDCTLTPYLVAKPKRPAVVLSESVREALQLARRTSQYLAEIARGESDALKRAAALHADLKEALLAWHQQPSELKIPVAAMVAQVPELQPLFSAISESGLLPSIDSAPVYVPRFGGRADDITSQANFLYGQRRAMTFAEFSDFHRSLGGTQSDEQIRASLIGGGFLSSFSQSCPLAKSRLGCICHQ